MNKIKKNKNILMIAAMAGMMSVVVGAIPEVTEQCKYQVSDSGLSKAATQLIKGKIEEEATKEANLLLVAEVARHLREWDHSSKVRLFIETMVSAANHSKTNYDLPEQIVTKLVQIHELFQTQVAETAIAIHSGNKVPEVPDEMKRLCEEIINSKEYGPYTVKKEIQAALSRSALNGQLEEFLRNIPDQDSGQGKAVQYTESEKAAAKEKARNNFWEELCTGSLNQDIAKIFAEEISANKKMEEQFNKIIEKYNADPKGIISDTDLADLRELFKSKLTAVTGLNGTIPEIAAKLGGVTKTMLITIEHSLEHPSPEGFKLIRDAYGLLKAYTSKEDLEWTVILKLLSGISQGNTDAFTDLFNNGQIKGIELVAGRVPSSAKTLDDLPDLLKGVIRSLMGEQIEGHELLRLQSLADAELNSTAKSS